MQSLYFLNPKFQASSHLLWSNSPVCVGPGRKPRRPVFLQEAHIYLLIQLLLKVRYLSYSFVKFAAIIRKKPIQKIALYLRYCMQDSNTSFRKATKTNGDKIVCWFDALRPGTQLCSCRDVTSSFVGLLADIEMK